MNKLWRDITVLGNNSISGIRYVLFIYHFNKFYIYFSYLYIFNFNLLTLDMDLCIYLSSKYMVYLFISIPGCSVFWTLVFLLSGGNESIGLCKVRCKCLLQSAQNMCMNMILCIYRLFGAEWADHSFSIFHFLHECVVF